MSGLSRTPGKRVRVNSPPRVRIPPSPPTAPRTILLPTRSTSRPAPERATRLFLALALVPALLSCQAKRLLVVTSEPPGARVLLDGTELGHTPLTEPFLHYGTRRLTYYLDGYLTHSEVIEMRPPWYGRFPLDIVSEILLPLGWRDEHPYHAELELGHSRIAEPDLESVLRRSDTLRTAGPEGPRSAQPAVPAPAVKERPHP